ncbi:restriction endonuclease [Paraglaciecola aestuariivivens]
MPRKTPSLLISLAYLPWWVSVLIGTIAYLVLRFFIPELVSENQILLMVATSAKNIAWLFGGVFIIPAILSIVKQIQRKKLIQHQTSIQTIKDLSWSDFEVLVGEAFRRKGYSVKENVVSGPDDGIDLTLQKNGKVYIVQCKQWRSSKVGVSVVREMFGVMKATNAEAVYVVASGYFTKEAIRFARDLPVKLIDGKQLLEMIAKVRNNEPNIVPKNQSNDSLCPKCSSPKVKRKAKKGPNVGKEFVGCSSFPKCRYIENSN